MKSVDLSACVSAQDELNTHFTHMNTGHFHATPVVARIHRALDRVVFFYSFFLITNNY